MGTIFSFSIYPMKYSLLLALSATTALLSACAKDKEFPAPVTPPVADTGYVRVVNNLAVRPGGTVLSGPIQLDVDGRLLGPASAVGTAAPYQAVPAGERVVHINLPVTSGLSWITFSRLPILKDHRYSLFTYNSGTNQSARVVEEAALPVVVAGKAQLRVLNLAAEPTPLRLEEPQAAAPLYADVAWGGVTSYQPVDARAYTLLASRTDGDHNKLFSQQVTLASGKAYTLVLRGSQYPDAAAPEKIAFDLIEDE